MAATNAAVQATIRRHAFEVADAISMTIDMNDIGSDLRRVVAEEWCTANATGRWLRRVVERKGEETTDRILFEFERQEDGDVLRDLLVERRW